MKKIVCLAATIAMSAITYAQTWVDITEEYVKNPSFENNSNEGWQIQSNANSTNTDYEGQEFWNGTWNIWQDITVPVPGKYRVCVQAFYRPGDNSSRAVDNYKNGTEVITCYLYANKDQVLLKSVYSETSQWNVGWGCWSPSGGGWGQGEYYPNDMSSASAFFNDYGAYYNELETNVDDNCQLTIGIRNSQNRNSNWTMMDNWQLFWYGTIVEPKSIAFPESKVTMKQGEELQLTTSFNPADATFKRIIYTSSNENAATVNENGLVTARKPGITTITATSAHNENITARCIITVEANEVSAKSVIFNEIQQSNLDMFLDPSFNFGGWVELYNSTDNPISLDGLYITDDPNNLQKMALHSDLHGIVPAHGFCTLWFDHLSRWAPRMMNFKLDCDGGNLYLSDENGTILSQLAYPPAITRTSYARTIDGGNIWNYTDQPTPTASNATSSFASTRLEMPSINAEGGFFTSSFTASVVIPSGATLRYTTDGSTPTLTNGKTSDNGRFDISETTILRLRFFKQGQLASPVLTRSFIYKDRDYTLPVISLVSDNKNLYGNDYGIFVRGNGNGRPGNGQSSKCNWNMDWDREANIEYFNETGRAVFSQEVGVEAAGGWSRAWEPHSFNIKAGKAYEGLNHMDFQFFENKPFLRHKGLKVRNGGNDTDCRIKDPAIQEVVRTSGLYIETQSYKPVHIFHNGKYIGVENLREPNNKDYAYANYGIDTDNLDQWKMSPDSGYVQQTGTRDVWEQWYTLAQSASDALAYEQIKQLVDIEEYSNYMAVELYLAGNDWPKNNIKAFRERSEGKSNSRFRFVLFDTDHAFSQTNPFTWFQSTQWYNFDKLYGVSDLYPSGRIYGEIEFTTIFLNMLQNEEFKKQFADQFCIVAGSVFEQSRSAQVINQMVAHVNPAMSLEGRSATSSANSVRNYFTNSRQSSLISSMRNFLDLGSSTYVSLSTNIDEATLRVNDLQVPTNKFQGTLFLPITLQASAPVGYKFLGWRTAEGGDRTVIFEKGSEWQYYDQGSLDDTEWKATSYNATDWDSGKAPLGYFTSDANNSRGYHTFLDYGGNSNNKYPTYYFRKQVNLTSTPKTSDTMTLDWVADDGFVVYVNGKEAGRFLMDNAPEQPTFNDYADTYADANPESGTMQLRASFFKKGNNVIAVEVHNNAANSTDIYWDAALYKTTQTTGDFISTEEKIELNVTGGTHLEATYEPLSSSELAISDAHPVKINEVSAANDIYVSDLFKKSDWIELYNTTDQNIDVEGMYLSDHLEEPEKWQIAAGNKNVNTIIPAHGHLVIWADKTVGNNQLHADFKLNNEDSCLVLLTAADKSWADTLVYCHHDGYHTVGLFPDGSSDLYVMERPTIGQTNVLTTMAIAWQEPVINKPEGPIDDYIRATKDNDLMAIHYDGKAITLHASATARLDIYTPSGQLVYTARIQPETAYALSSLPHGIYIAKATIGDDETTLKFTIQ